MPPQRSESHPLNDQYVRVRTTLSALVFFLLVLPSFALMTPEASSDPDYVNNGDYTESVFWNFTDPSSYALTSTAVSGGQGMLEFVNETIAENSTAQYLLGARTNVDVQSVPDAMTIDNASLAVQTMTLQPGSEGID